MTVEIDVIVARNIHARLSFRSLQIAWVIQYFHIMHMHTKYRLASKWLVH